MIGRLLDLSSLSLLPSSPLAILTVLSPFGTLPRHVRGHQPLITRSTCGGKSLGSQHCRICIIEQEMVFCLSLGIHSRRCDIRSIVFSGNNTNAKAQAFRWNDTGSMTMLAEGSSLKDGSHVLAKIAPAQSNGSMCLEREAHMYVY